MLMNGVKRKGLQNCLECEIKSLVSRPSFHAKTHVCKVNLYSKDKLIKRLVMEKYDKHLASEWFCDARS
jgi:hypothetical protein